MFWTMGVRDPVCEARHTIHMIAGKRIATFVLLFLFWEMQKKKEKKEKNHSSHEKWNENSNDIFDATKKKKKKISFSSSLARFNNNTHAHNKDVRARESRVQLLGVKCEKQKRILCFYGCIDANSIISVSDSGAGIYSTHGECTVCSNGIKNSFRNFEHGTTTERAHLLAPILLRYGWSSMF